MGETIRRFGRYDVSILRDGFFTAPSDVLTHTAGAAARENALALWGKPTIGIEVNCFLLRGPDGITLVDAGTGASWGDAFGHARSELVEAGVEAGQVDRILITHLHGDHALGLFDGDRPYFPNAEIVVPEVDFAYFTDEAKRAAAPKARQGGFDIAATLQRLYGGRIRTVGQGEVLPGIEALPLPGHTHGHGGYLIGDAAHRLLLWGDVLHLMDLQASDPDIGLTFDLDGATAAQTRHATLERAAREGWIVSGGHVEGFRTVQRTANGYELLPD